MAISDATAAAVHGYMEADRLFDRFYTVENAKGSTGLGLSIAKQLTEKMGGSSRAELERSTGIPPGRVLSKQCTSVGIT